MYTQLHQARVQIPPTTAFAPVWTLLGHVRVQGLVTKPVCACDLCFLQQDAVSSLSICFPTFSRAHVFTFLEARSGRYVGILVNNNLSLNSVRSAPALSSGVFHANTLVLCCGTVGLPACSTSVCVFCLCHVTRSRSP